MASLERSRLTATLPRGAGGTEMNGSIQRKNAATATRGTEARVERIAGLKREVNEKLHQIAAHSGKQPVGQSALIRPKVGLSKDALTAGSQASTVVGTRTRNPIQTRPDVAGPGNVVGSSSTRPGVVLGRKRSRRQSGHFAAMTSSDEDSSSDEVEIERSPKKRKTELEAADVMEVDNETMITDSMFRWV